MYHAQEIILTALLDNHELDERFGLCFIDITNVPNEANWKEYIKIYFYKKITLSLGKSAGVAMADTADIVTGEGASIRKQNSITTKKK